MQMTVDDNKKSDRNPFIREGKPLDFENTIYPQLGITREEDQKNFTDYIKQHKHLLKPPDIDLSQASMQNSTAELLATYKEYKENSEAARIQHKQRQADMAKYLAEQADKKKRKKRTKIQKGMVKK